MVNIVMYKVVRITRGKKSCGEINSFESISREKNYRKNAIFRNVKLLKSIY